LSHATTTRRSRARPRSVAAGWWSKQERAEGERQAIVPVRDEERAIAMANASSFGLGGGVITRDTARGERVAAERIDSGCVFVNDAVRSDPRLPFGGIKERGYGRELASLGIREFVDIKTGYVP
jgi:succinate-semialdehyde dehydrogenase/glutarate-semialdehyde dehydrogenase